MSRSRPDRLRVIEPGVTYLVTKKTTDDLFLIVPSEVVNEILTYTLVLMSCRYGVLVHGYCFMSNHLHLLVTDVRAELPSFMQQFLSQTSKALQVATGVERPIWNSEPYSAIALLDLDAAERKIVYTLLNPTRAGLTEPTEWPGVTSAGLRFGQVITAKRPKVYFSARYRPESVSMVLAPLPQPFDRFREGGPEEDMSEEDRAAAERESEARIQALLETELEETHRELEAEGKSLAGPERVLKTSRETRGSHPVRNRRPRFATRDPLRLAQALYDRHEFAKKHEKARQRYVSGHHQAVFPPGTYGYHRLLGVRVAKVKGGAAA